MNKASALHLVYSIITDKRNENRYCMTQIRDRETLTVEATYSDAVKVIEELYNEEKQKEKAPIEGANK